MNCKRPGDAIGIYLLINYYNEKLFEGVNIRGPELY